MSRTASLLSGALALALCTACSKTTEPTEPSAGSAASVSIQPWFEEVALASQLDFVHVQSHQKRFWMPEISPGGVAFLDYDGDGWLDVYCIQAGDPAEDAQDVEPNRLYRNLGDGRFEDVTESAGVGDRGYGHGCATGDYDNDGDVDLYVTNLRANVLYRNEGDGSFRDVTVESGTGVERWSTACAFTDYDADGFLDLFVVNNLNWSPEVEIECRSAQAERDYCSPKNYNLPTTDSLFHNDGHGSFSDVTTSSGIAAATGIGLGVAVADFDNDGRVDFYVANDSVPNLLWISDGQGGFENEALLAGCAVNGSGASEAGMGVQALDVENDGDWDLYMTHVRDETNTFYLNRNGSFRDATTAVGLSGPSRASTGFGMAFHDLDHDGRLDLFVANGRVDLWQPFFDDEHPYVEPNQVFRGLEGSRFEQIDAGIGGLLGASRGAAFGDYDNDGDIDVVYMDLDAPVRLLRNIAPKVGHWIGFRLLNEHGSDALGAVARIDTSAGTQYRLCHTAYSYCAANDPRVHFGLGAAERADRIEIRWPDGRREAFADRPADAYHELHVGEGTPIPE